MTLTVRCTGGTNLHAAPGCRWQTSNLRTTAKYLVHKPEYGHELPWWSSRQWVIQLARNIVVFNSIIALIYLYFFTALLCHMVYTQRCQLHRKRGGYFLYSIWCLQNHMKFLCNIHLEAPGLWHRPFCHYSSPFLCLKQGINMWF